MGVNSLPKTVTRQRRDCDLNLRSSAPESSTLTTRLPSHPYLRVYTRCLLSLYSRSGIESESNVLRPVVRLLPNASVTNGSLCFHSRRQQQYTVSRYIVMSQLNAYSRYIHALLTSNGCYITGALNGSTKAHAPLLRFVVDLSNCCVYDKSTTVRSNGVWGFGLNHGAGFLSFMRLAYTAVKASSMSPQFTLWFCSI